MLLSVCVLAALTVFISMGREEPNVAVQFQGLPETIELFASGTRIVTSCPAGEKVSPLFRTP